MKTGVPRRLIRSKSLDDESIRLRYHADIANEKGSAEEERLWG